MQPRDKLKNSIQRILRTLSESLFGTVKTWHLWWYIYAPTEAINFLAGLASWYFFSIYAAGAKAEEFFSFLAIGLLVNPVFLFAVENPYQFTRALYAGWFSSYGYRLKMRDYYKLAGVTLTEYMASRFIESFLFLLVRFAAYLSVLTLVFGVVKMNVNLLDTAAVLTLGFAATLPLGLLLASTYALYYNMPQVVMNPFIWAVELTASIVCGIYFPPTILPPPLKTLSWLLPQTYAIDAARQVLLNHAPLTALTRDIQALTLFTLLNIPVLLVYKKALRYIDRHV